MRVKDNKMFFPNLSCKYCSEKLFCLKDIQNIEYNVCDNFYLLRTCRSCVHYDNQMHKCKINSDKLDYCDYKLRRQLNEI